MESHARHEALIDLSLLMEQTEITLMTSALGRERATEFSARSVPSFTVCCIVTWQV